MEKTADLDKTLKTIEFDKVLVLLSKHAQSRLGKERCLLARPADNNDEIIKNLKVTTQAQNAYRISGNALPLNDFYDIDDTAKKLKNKLPVSIEEIKNLYNILCTTRYMSAYLNKYAKEYAQLYAYNETLFPSKETEERTEAVSSDACFVG